MLTVIVAAKPDGGGDEEASGLRTAECRLFLTFSIRP